VTESNRTQAFSLEGETALITGGGTGLGFGIASALVACGARVVLTGRRERVLADAVNALGPQAAYEVHDINQLATADSLIERVSSSAGPVSILVNNAGIHLKKPFLDTSDQELLNVLQTHLLGAYALSRAAARPMVARGHGVLIFLASMASLLGIPNVVAYTVAKSAYVGLVRSLSSELSPHGVRVNAIAPGWIETPMLHQALDNDPARKARILERTPMARFGSPEDIGWAAAYLCSRAGRFVTGVVLPVDGGASIGF
jgi:NAD(P)-dependent dehydrogenase (short-subunit alcohol dehydrogenase family)